MPPLLRAVLPQSVRMVVTDLDGTLATTSSHISATNLRALRRLGRLDCVRVVATGRNLASALRVLSLPPLPCSIEGRSSPRGLVRPRATRQPDATAETVLNSTPIDFLLFSSGAGLLDWRTHALLEQHSLSDPQLQDATRLLLKTNADFALHHAVPDNHVFSYFSPAATLMRTVTRNPHPDFLRRIACYKEYARELKTESEVRQLVGLDRDRGNSASRAAGAMTSVGTWRVHDPTNFSQLLAIFPPSNDRRGGSGAASEPKTSSELPQSYPQQHNEHPQERSSECVRLDDLSHEQLFEYFSVRLRPLGLHTCRTTSPLDGKSMWLEIFPEHVCKGQGVERLAQRLDIGMNQTVCVGNDYNDLDMLRLAGRALVVANAPADLLTQFESVPSNDQHGFAHAVDLCFGKQRVVKPRL